MEASIPTADQIIQIHDLILEADGGLRGVRDRNALEAALGRPLMKLHYQDGVSFFELVACVGYGLCMSHAFIDGNKRVSYAVVEAMLGYYDRQMAGFDVAHIDFWQQMAAGRKSETDLADFIQCASS